jgi:hemoglobin
MSTAPASPPVATPFERLGGEPAVRALVERFYDLMEQEPFYAELRAMHAADLSPMRLSLTQFLTAWLGGPRDWYAARPGTCVMSIHSRMTIAQETAGQWVHAMSRAMAECRVDPALGTQLQQAFLRMASAMMMR